MLDCHLPVGRQAPLMRLAMTKHKRHCEGHKPEAIQKIGLSYLQKIKPKWPLRLGLGFMYLFSAYDIWAHPSAWYWAVRPLPQFIRFFIYNQIGIDTYLRIQAVGELALAAFFLLWFLPRGVLRFAAGLAALEMFLILWLIGIDAITFRDIGLLGAAAALFLLSSEYIAETNS